LAGGLWGRRADPLGAVTAGRSSLVADRRALRKNTRAIAPATTHTSANRPIAITAQPAPSFFLLKAVRRAVVEGVGRQGGGCIA
jgi:hypothetical protein